MYLVRCSICLKPWYLFFAQDVIFFLIRLYLRIMLRAELAVSGTECHASRIMLRASSDLSQYLSNWKVLFIRLSVL
jgi:hypothetical protein